MTDRELMQQALDALDGYARNCRCEGGGAPCDAAKALRARLAQPELLPAKSKGALSHEENKQHNKKILDKFYEENAHLYTAPPQREWQGLTDEELRDAYCEVTGDEWCLGGISNAETFYDVIEVKLKEKNT